MQRERVSDNVYWFQSEVYAQVTAGAITGPQWAVVIDTLALPEETREMRDFLEDDLGIPVRYVINTHSHADHSWGNCFFPGRDDHFSPGVPESDGSTRHQSTGSSPTQQPGI